ncbi:MAG: hypothetical protein JXB45_06045 [Candidatus Krumholzibacteriota bacterium]|nr:hypothetical protein [Candidatus Krumholzibacteriota bacterium]
MTDRIKSTETVIPSYNVVLPDKSRREKKKKKKDKERKTGERQAVDTVEEEHLVDRRA